MEHQLDFRGQHAGPEGMFIDPVAQVLEFTVVVGSLYCPHFLSGYLKSEAMSEKFTITLCEINILD